MVVVVLEKEGRSEGRRLYSKAGKYVLVCLRSGS